MIFDKTASACRHRRSSIHQSQLVHSLFSSPRSSVVIRSSFIHPFIRCDHVQWRFDLSSLFVLLYFIHSSIVLTFIGGSTIHPHSYVIVIHSFIHSSSLHSHESQGLLFARGSSVPNALTKRVEKERSILLKEKQCFIFEPALLRV